MKKKIISILLPCHNEAKNIDKLIPEIIKYIPGKFGYEIICIDDGSVDDTLNVIKKFAKINKKVKGISFYRNFGHQQALVIGIKKAIGNAIITMDADFQHPPKYIPRMIALWEKGHDLVLLKRDKESYINIIDRIQRQTGYQIWKWVSDGTLIPGASEFRLMDKKVAGYLNKTRENEIFIRGLVKNAAKNTAVIPYKLGARKYGKSSYNLSINRNLFINGLISFSVKPLRIATYLGLILGASSFLFLLIDTVQALVVKRRFISGYLTIVFLMMILNGFIIFYLGILGEYLGVIFKEVKNRPRYIIEETINLK